MGIGVNSSQDVVKLSPPAKTSLHLPPPEKKQTNKTKTKANSNSDPCPLKPMCPASSLNDTPLCGRENGSNRTIYHDSVIFGGSPDFPDGPEDRVPCPAFPCAALQCCVKRTKRKKAVGGSYSQ